MFDFHSVQCPYCGEALDVFVDAEVSQDYIEDCQVCCNPIEFHVEVDIDGNISAVKVRREDE